MRSLRSPERQLRRRPLPAALYVRFSVIKFIGYTVGSSGIALSLGFHVLWQPQHFGAALCSLHRERLG